MKRQTDPLLADVIATIHNSTQTHSPLYIWMKHHYDELASAMSAGVGQIGWKKLTVQFTNAGLTNAWGEPLTVAAVRKTWWRVAKDVAAKPKPTPTPQPKPTPRPIEKPASVSQPTSSTGNTQLDDFLDQINKR